MLMSLPAVIYVVNVKMTGTKGACRDYSKVALKNIEDDWSDESFGRGTDHAYAVEEGRYIFNGEDMLSGRSKWTARISQMEDY